MKLLTFCSYFSPERAAGIYLTEDVLEGAAKAGFTVQAFAPTPTRGVTLQIIQQYKKIRMEERCQGRVCIHRFRMMQEGKNPIGRALRYILLNLAFIWKGMKSNADVIFIDSTPPTQGVMAAFLKKLKKIPIVYNLQDVFPDSMVTTGMTHEGSLIWKIGRIVENVTYKNADVIITISQAMKRNIMAKGVPEAKIRVVCNWIDTDKIQPVKKQDNRLFEEFGIDREKFTVVYAGNFGAAQGADVVLEAAKLLPDIQFVIFGGGAEFEQAKKQAEALPNVIINGLLPLERVPEVYSLGDLCLITCKKGVGNSGMPSKTWSIMACGTPIVAAFDTDSELAEVISEANAGICVEPENPERLAQAITTMKANASQYGGGRAYVCENASKTVCVKKYVEVLKREAKVVQKAKL